MGSAWDIAAVWLLDATVKSILIFAAALLLCAVLQRHPASSRHSIWVAAMVGMFCLPLLRLTLPALQLHVLPPVVASSHVQPDPKVTPHHSVMAGIKDVPSAARNFSPRRTASIATVKNGVVENAISNNLAAPVTKKSNPRITLRTVASAMILLWITGVIFLVMRLTAGLVGAGRLVRNCQLMPLTSLVEEGRRLLAIDSHIEVRIGKTGGRPRVPMTRWGRVPIILLPCSALEWEQDKLRSVILHEMAHVKRLDWFTMLLAQLVCAVYWMNPLAWTANRLLRLEAEKASDELVLRSGVSPTDYAAHLLAIARTLVPGDQPVAAMAMARQPEIAQRLSAILAFRSGRTGKGSGRALGMTILVAAVLVSAVQLSPRGQAVRAAAINAASDILHAQLVNTFVTDSSMNSVTFTPDSARLLTGSWDAESKRGRGPSANIAFWSVASGKQVLGKRLTTPLVAAQYSPDGKLLATLYAGGYLHISNGDTGLTLRAIQLPSAALDTLEFSPDGLTVACATVGDGKTEDTANRFYLVDTATAKVRGSEYRGIFRHLQQHWDGHPFTVAPQQWRIVQWDSKVTLWSPQWGKPTLGLDVAADTCASHSRFLAILKGGRVQVWDTTTRKPLTSFATGLNDSQGRSRLVFSPDGHSLAIAADGAIKVWRIDGLENIDTTTA